MNRWVRRRWVRRWISKEWVWRGQAAKVKKKEKKKGRMKWEYLSKVMQPRLPNSCKSILVTVINVLLLDNGHDLLHSIGSIIHEQRRFGGSKRTLSSTKCSWTLNQSRTTRSLRRMKSLFQMRNGTKGFWGCIHTKLSFYYFFLNFFGNAPAQF